MSLDSTRTDVLLCRQAAPLSRGRAWAGQDRLRGGHASREPPETGPVIPGNLPAHTDRVPVHPHPKIGTDSGPDDVQHNSTSTPEAALTLPFSFLETGNEKPETRKTNSSKESYPVRPNPKPASAGFTFQPGCLRPGDAGTGEARWGTPGVLR